MNSLGRIAVSTALLGLAACEASDGQATSGLLGTPTEIASIGTLEGPIVLGDIEDAVFGPDESVLILDQQVPSVVHVTSDGSLIREYDAVGDGPGELQGPTELDLVGDSLSVLDPQARAVLRFRVNDFQFLGQTRLDGIAWDYCSVGGRSFVHGSRDGGLVAEIAPDGTDLRTFAPELQLPEGELTGLHAAFVGQYRHLGKVVCLPSGIVLFGSESPVVRFFSLEGEEQWATTLADFDVALYDTSGARPVRDGDDPFDVVVSAFPWDSEHVVVQIEGRAGGDVSPLSSRVLSVATGDEISRIEGLPEVLDTRDGRLLGVQHDPFPRVLVLRR